jgi:hypothetical protein
MPSMCEVADLKLGVPGEDHYAGASDMTAPGGRSHGVAQSSASSSSCVIGHVNELLE